MPAFESWHAYGTFANHVRRESRHIMDLTDNRFLKAVIKTSAKRERTIKKGELLWRAQLGHDWRPETIEGIKLEVAIPYSKSRMVPLPNRSEEHTSELQ